MHQPRWSAHQLAEFLSVVSSSESEASAARAAVERAAEALDAEVAAIVGGSELVTMIGYPEDAAPLDELSSVTPGNDDCKLDVPGVGQCPATAVSLEHPPGAKFVVARSATGGLTPEEASVLRGMARVTSLTLRMFASHAQLAASRARIVATADETRRRIERDLHDGIQQRLVALALDVHGIRKTVSADREVVEQLSHVEAGLREVLDELREISHGVHPAILSKGGLGPALKSLAKRATVPVELEVGAVGRLPEPVEVAAYYVVSEALANTAKHASASRVRVNLETRDGKLYLSICDDGVGGADAAHGSGIIGLTDRVEALGGTIAVKSPRAEGTSIVVHLPLEVAAQLT